MFIDQTKFSALTPQGCQGALWLCFGLMISAIDHFPKIRAICHNPAFADTRLSAIDARDYSASGPNLPDVLIGARHRFRSDRKRNGDFCASTNLHIPNWLNMYCFAFSSRRYKCSGEHDPGLETVTPTQNDGNLTRRVVSPVDS